MRRILDKKKAQQEIIGFVIIIVIVAVVGVIFLGISLRRGMRDDSSVQDAEIANFLSTSAKYTTDCVLKEGFYAELEDITDACYNSKICTDNREACDILASTYEDMTRIVWPAGEDRPIKYTKLLVYYQESADEPGARSYIIDAIEHGNQELCSSRRSGKHQQYKHPGNIVVELEICS